MAHEWGPQENWLGGAEQRGWLVGSSKEVGVGQRFGVTDTQVLQGSGSGGFHTGVPDDVISPSVPPPPSPDNRSSLGSENQSLPPWSLGDFEQLVTSLTLHDPNIFGPQ